MSTLTADHHAAVRPSLSVAMRDGSRAEHQAAESSTYMAELLDGRLTGAAYADLLLRLRRVYAALEATVRAGVDDPIVAAVYDPVLERLGAIDRDLAHWAPDRSPASVDSPATDAYVVRLHGARWGGAVVAHHYTRYLGDLSGGQAIGRVLQRSYDLPPTGAGVRFYAFDEIAKPKLYKDAYRARLDALALSPAEIDRVVAEVKIAFNLNQALFAELGTHIAGYRR